MGRLRCWPEIECGLSLKARMNQGITDEGTPELACSYDK